MEQISTHLKACISVLCDYKENVLYYHFDVYNEEYYNAVKNIEKLNARKKELQTKVSLNREMIYKIDRNTNNIDYSIRLRWVNCGNERV